MVCPHCGAQWQLPSDNNTIAKICPFCHGDMCAPNSHLSTIGEVLKEIVARFGTHVLNDGEELLSLFASLAPSLTKEKTLLQFVIAYDGHIEFWELSKTAPTEQVIRYQKHSKQLSDKVIEICDGFMSALNIDFSSATQPSNVLEYEYADLGNNSIELTFCRSPIPEEIVFPQFIDGKRVVSISGTILGLTRGKDSDRNNVKSICIPEGVVSIGNNAFYGCKTLSMVTLPQSLTSIGEYTFRSCKGLSSITIPNQVRHIGKGAFSGSNITSIELPEGITTIHDEVFKNCKCLSNINFPNSLTKIGESAFAGCRSIVRLTIPQNTESLGKCAFQECKFLTSVTLPDNLKVLGSEAFGDCERLLSINLPESIVEIGFGAFSRCFALNNIVLPSGLAEISGSLFDRCTSLAEIIIPDGVTYIGYDAFYSCEALKCVTIPSSVKSIESDAFSYCKNLTVYCAPDTFAHTYAKKKRWKVISLDDLI